jgi:hypothetical protein
MRQPTPFAATASTYLALFVEKPWLANLSYAANVTVFHIYLVLNCKYGSPNIVVAETLIGLVIVVRKMGQFPFLLLFSVFYATGRGCPSPLDFAVNTGIYPLY